MSRNSLTHRIVILFTYFKDIVIVLHLDAVAGSHHIGGDDIGGGLDNGELFHGGRRWEDAGSMERLPDLLVQLFCYSWRLSF